MSKNKKIWLTSFVVILVGLFVVALQYSEISMNQKLKALETNKDKNTFIQLDTENLEIGSDFNLTMFVHPELTTAIELPLPVGIDFQAEQLESADYQVSYDSTSRLITIQPKITEVQLTENDSAIEAETSERDEREPLMIPLALKVDKAGEFLLEAKTVSQENSLASNQLTFNVTETYEDVDLEADGESEEPIADVPSVDVPMVDGDAPLLSRSTKAAVANVGTWTEFVAAIANPSISKINLTKDITRKVTTDANNPGMLTRSLTIQGNNFTINFGSGGATKNGILLGRVYQATTLTLANVQLVKNETPTVPIVNDAVSLSGWVINISDVTTPDTNTSGLVYSIFSTVNLSGTNNLSLNAKASHFKVSNIVFEENSIFKSESKALDSGTAIGIYTGTVLIKKKAKVTINNAGTVRVHMEPTSANVLTMEELAPSSSAITGLVRGFKMEEKSEFSTAVYAHSFRSSLACGFYMTGGASFEAVGNNDSAVHIAAVYRYKPSGMPSTVELSGAGTRLRILAEEPYSKSGSNSIGSAMYIYADGSKLNVLDGAECSITVKKGTALTFQGETDLSVMNKAKLTLKQTEGEGATLNFLNFVPHTLNITGDSELNIIKYGGQAPGVYMLSKNNGSNFNKGNIINVNTGGQFNVRNYGNGTPNNGLDVKGNQGLFISGGGPGTLNLKDTDSSVNIRADFGPAFCANGTSSQIAVREETIFKLRGNTSSQGNGIIQLGLSTKVDINSPLFFDLRNDRADGVVFNAKKNSTLISTQSDLSVWTRGANLDGDQSKNWSLFDYKLGEANFSKIVSTNIPTEFNKAADSFGPTGAVAYARMTGSKVRAVVDELRAPTNADKSIFGHVTIPVGGKNGRDAWTDEAYVVVKLTKANGRSQELTGSTIGKNNTSPGLSVYGEDSRGGMFKIPVPNNVFLETGDKIEVVRAWRGGADPNSNRVHVSLPEDLIAPNRITFDIIPPKPASITNSRVIDNATKQISGTSDEPGSDVEISVNGTNLATTAKVQANGEFTFNLPHYLEKGDVVQVKLRDHAGLASGVDVDHPPSINNAVGNSNPSKNLTFHDTIFVAAPSVTVADSLPDINKAVKSVAVDNNKNVTQMGSILTYTIDVANNKAAAISTSWSEVTIEDQLDAGLNLDLNSFSLNGKAIPAANVQFNAKTRLLKVAVGNLATREKAKLTFKARVNKTSIGRTILNKATVSGNSPREVEPFEIGPEKPTAEKQKIKTVSNEIANPGGSVLGVLKLVSAPTDISFGKDLKISTKNERYPVAKMSGGLTVQDSRAVKSSWSMTARMVAVLESGEGKKLPNALYYTYKGTDQILGTDSILVYRHTSTNENPLTISDSWNTKEGLSLRLQVGKAYTGRYRGEIEWTLQDTPEN